MTQLDVGNSPMCQMGILLLSKFIMIFSNVYILMSCCFRFRSCYFLKLFATRGLIMAASSSPMEELFGIFFETYKKFHVSANGKAAQQECSTIWRGLKQKDFESTKAEAEKVMWEWKTKAKVPGKGSIASFWSKTSTKKKGKASLFSL